MPHLPATVDRLVDIHDHTLCFSMRSSYGLQSTGRTIPPIVVISNRLPNCGVFGFFGNDRLRNGQRITRRTHRETGPTRRWSSRIAENPASASAIAPTNTPTNVA